MGVYHILGHHHHATRASCTEPLLQVTLLVLKLEEGWTPLPFLSFQHLFPAAAWGSHFPSVLWSSLSWLSLPLLFCHVLWGLWNLLEDSALPWPLALFSVGMQGTLDGSHTEDASFLP